MYHNAPVKDVKPW